MHRTQNPIALAANTDDLNVTAADILRGAARYLDLRGWTQHVYYGGTAADAFPPACADGALGMASYGYCCLVPGDNTDDPGHRVYRRALDCLSDYLDRSEATLTLVPAFGPDDEPVEYRPDVFDWNDRDGQTAETVIATLRAAADEYDWQHATEDDLETYADICAGREEHPDRDGFLAWRAARR